MDWINSRAHGRNVIPQNAEGRGSGAIVAIDIVRPGLRNVGLGATQHSAAAQLRASAERERRTSPWVLGTDHNKALAACDLRHYNLLRESGWQEVMAAIEGQWGIIRGKTKTNATFQWRGSRVPVAVEKSSRGPSALLGLDGVETSGSPARDTLGRRRVNNKGNAILIGGRGKPAESEERLVSLVLYAWTSQDDAQPWYSKEATLPIYAPVPTRNSAAAVRLLATTSVLSGSAPRLPPRRRRVSSWRRLRLGMTRNVF
ncbi:hypothetical protein B0H14DRAFT_2562846 [Mycena olivaceomarginata]|nr:hypothetical protein B0H14DRAFT_2562846 [Mycena olivaceomarginata]